MYSKSYSRQAPMGRMKKSEMADNEEQYQLVKPALDMKKNKPYSTDAICTGGRIHPHMNYSNNILLNYDQMIINH